MGTDGARGLLFCAAKRSGTFPPNMPAGLRARVSRLGAGYLMGAVNVDSVLNLLAMGENRARLANYGRVRVVA
jgi:hypothetical protein